MTGPESAMRSMYTISPSELDWDIGLEADKVSGAGSMHPQNHLTNMRVRYLAVSDVSLVLASDTPGRYLGN